MRWEYHTTAEHLKKEKKSAGKMDLERSIVSLNTISSAENKSHG